MIPPTLFVLTGLPGAGKSRRAAEIAARTGAVHVCMDAAMQARGVSIVDFEARALMQPEVEATIPPILAAGTSVIAEFGSWSREERARLRHLADASRARTELHYLDAPPETLVARLRARGGDGDEALVDVIRRYAPSLFEPPTAAEGAAFDAYVADSAESMATEPPKSS
jgi:predicted kinase